MAIVDGIVKILTEFGTTAVPDLQSSLNKKLAAKAAKYGSRVVESRGAASITFQFPSKSGGIVHFVIKMNDYLEAVDKGRKPSPVSEVGMDNLGRWAETRGIAEKLRVKDLERRKLKQASNKTNRPKKVLKKMPMANAKNSIAFLVARKLKAKGFDGNHFFSEVINDGRLDELKTQLKALLKEEIRVEIVNGLQ